jgi:glutamyl-tRNA reductase
MRGDPSSPVRLVVCGFGHRSSPAALRERLFVADEEAIGFLADLRAIGIDQAVLLSTCDRVEIQGAAADPGQFTQKVLGVFARRSGLETGEIGKAAHVFNGDEALRHIFAVAASLDSQIVGEPQVLGQVKEAHRRSRDAGLLGPELDAALQAAYGAAKRIRSTTALGERPVTLASAAVQVARDVHGDLSGCSGLLIGPGDMGELLVEHFRAAGLRQLTVTGPNPTRVEAMARALECHVEAYATLPVALGTADIVIAALGSGQHAVTASMVEMALRRRRRRAILFLDLGVPADVEPAIEPLDGAFRYDLDDLERVAMSGRLSREAASAEAWAIVDVELAAYTRARAGRDAVPIIMALRNRFEAERARVLLEAGNDPARATELLINRLLHDPSQALRQIAASADPKTRLDVERLLSELFAIRSDNRSDEEPKP